MKKGLCQVVAFHWRVLDFAFSALFINRIPYLSIFLFIY